MAPIKKHSDRSGSSQNHHKKAKNRRPSKNLDLIYKYLGNLCDLKDERAENSKRNCHRNCHQNRHQNCNQKKNSKRKKQDDDTKCTNSDQSFKDFDSREEHSDNKEYDDCASESSSVVSKDESKSDSKGDLKMKSYVRKALHIGVQNGYLEPAGTSCRILRVASDLVELKNRKRKYERPHSHDTIGENDEVQDRKKRRRSKGRRSKSRRKSRSRRRRRLSNTEESEEMADDDEKGAKSDNQDEREEKKRKKEEDQKRNSRNSKSKISDSDAKDAMKQENSDDECSDDDLEKKD